MSQIPVIDGSAPTQREQLEQAFKAATGNLAAAVCRDIPAPVWALICPETALDPDIVAERAAKYAIGVANRVIGYFLPTTGSIN